MAHLSGTFFSDVMKRSMHFSAVLSNDSSEDPEKNPHYQRPKRNVYLLHGYCGCDTDWAAYAPLAEIAGRYNVNFFMPSCENSFYLDQPATGFQYAEYTGKEFIEYTRKTFNLSCKKEDTYIGGLSMGGFGAIHTGLAYPENFSKIIALSSALIANEVAKMAPGKSNGVANYEYYRQMFGDPQILKNSENDPEYLVKKLLAEKAEIPGIFMACGTEDNLLPTNQEFADFLEANGVPCEFVKEPGIHDFNFWRKHLITGLDWAE